LKSRPFAAEIATRQPLFRATCDDRQYQMPPELQIGSATLMHIALARALLPSLLVMHCARTTIENSQDLWQLRSMK
jgi:hypothetical protein